MLIDFYREGKGRREGEKHQCERETSTGCLLHMTQLGTEPTTFRLLDNAPPELHQPRLKVFLIYDIC